jgi:hypothetical protein
VVAGPHEQTDITDLQDDELGCLHRGAEAPRITDDPLTGSALRSNVTRGGIDEQTFEARAIEITGSNTGDAPMQPHLLNQIPCDQQIGSVTADGAYDTRRCHNAVHCPAVHVYMHERGRARCGCGDTATQKCPTMEANHCRCHRQERRTPRIETSGSGTLAKLEDTTAEAASRQTLSGIAAQYPSGQWMHCMTLLSQRLPLIVCKQTTAGQWMARDFDRQVAEVQVRVAILNGDTALGIPVTKAVG